MLDQTTTLDDLVARIEAEHATVGTALRSALAHAIACGKWLIAAKAQVRAEIGYGRWLEWLAIKTTVPKRTAAHYMRLAREREVLCDQNGNILPMSVNEALDWLKHPADRGGQEEAGIKRLSVIDLGGRPRWGPLAWGWFGEALQAVIQLPQLHPPAPRIVVKAYRAGKTPDLSAAVLREVSALLARYADALDEQSFYDADQRPRVARVADLLMRRSHSEGRSIETKVGWNTVTFDGYFETLAIEVAGILKTDRAIRQLRWALADRLYHRRLDREAAIAERRGETP